MRATKRDQRTTWENKQKKKKNISDANLVESDRKKKKLKKNGQPRAKLHRLIDYLTVAI